MHVVNAEDSLFESDEDRFLSVVSSVRDKLDAQTQGTYKRLNPLTENLCDWNERASRYLSENSTLYDSATLIGDISCGEHAWVGPQCMLDGTGGLEIGSYCVFAAGTQVYTHDTAKWALSGGKSPYEYSPVTIGDCVFIGAQSIITRGVSIGSHSLIAANSTVTKDVPSYSIVAGSPAKVIGKVVIEEDTVRYEFIDS